MPPSTECLRQLAKEARIVLVSLRSGPPHSPLLAQLDAFLCAPSVTLDPFLAVITHPDAAGPQTLAALKSVRRLWNKGIVQHGGGTLTAESVCTGILGCKFEQTDNGIDEAVEMAIADTLCVLQELSPETFMDAFHTVFVTRQTFAHRPAMAYHLEDSVLMTMVHSACTVPETRRVLLEFLVHPLLHTPLHSEATDERLLCLRLIRRFVVQTGSYNDKAVMALIQDDLCLSLLMTGQAALQGQVEFPVLQEICGVIEEIWIHYGTNAMSATMEAIWTGFYTRALVLVRQQERHDGAVLIVLESLADLLTFHDHEKDSWGTLKTLYRNYDCHLQRPNVATHLVLELSHCCGGSKTVSTELERSYSTESLGTAPEMVERSVPTHLIRICARALQASMQCLFGDDHASPETLVLRQQRQRSCLNGQHPLQRLKYQKRQLAKAARLFNRKCTTGLSMLQDCSGKVLTYTDVAQFLRDGLVVGLDKRAVGEYLGMAGKKTAMVAWEGDAFHAQVLETYCALFDFESQSLLDALRMFLAAFRLPGEAQQIDRILQAFADRCSRVCDERSANIFSTDPKKASDAAYLLSFSIIMLNTDRHNANIREDRKMSLEDFIKNNADYGKEISDGPFPREYLTSIYESISQEEIRTEGEGADGAMTVERWKDVLRSSSSTNDVVELNEEEDAQDLTELVLEYIWRPIVAAIGGLWEYSGGAPRMGMEMSIELLQGVRRLGRKDIFCKIFASLCDFSGLLGDYGAGPDERLQTFCNSLESQAAVVVIVQTAVSAAEDLNEDCWKRVWYLLSELRDLKLLSSRTLQQESEPDFLTSSARRKWTTCLEKGDMEYEQHKKEKVGGNSLLGVFGRAIFGPVEEDPFVENREDPHVSSHGKEALVVWNDFAPSDDENDDKEAFKELPSSPIKEVGISFEELLVTEATAPSSDDVPVTGLERMEDSKLEHSMRYRVRQRLCRLCDFPGLIAESRFLDDASIEILFQSLVNVTATANDMDYLNYHLPEPPPSSMERAESDISVSTGASAPAMWTLPLSPGSEAFIEVIISELAVKNRDRLKSIWLGVLRDHYMGQLTSLLVNQSSPSAEASSSPKIPANPGLEKRVTGLLRLCSCAVQRPEITNEVLAIWKYVLPVTDDQHASSPLRALHKHVGEGLWRIVAQVERLANLNEEGWEGLIALIHWCGKRGSQLKPIDGTSQKGLPEDDTALQSYRALHLLLHTEELNEKVPWTVVWALRCLVATGSRRHYGQLSMASLDLLGVLHEKKVSISADDSPFWTTGWTKIVEGIAEAAELASDSNIRQHALSMLTDLFLHKKKDKQDIPADQLCRILSEVCVPMAGRRILGLQIRDPSVETSDQLMMEFELCIGLIFKPLRHHLQYMIESGGSLQGIWKAVLGALEELLGKKEGGREGDVIPSKLKETMNNLANEHLQSAIQTLLSSGVLANDDGTPGDITSLTWESVGRMGVSKEALAEWKQKSPSE